MVQRGNGEREGDAAGRWRSLSEREEISPEEKLGMAGDGDGGWRSLREEGDLREEEEPEKMAARRSGGGGLRRRRLEDGGVAMTMVKNPWPGQGVAAVVAAAAAVGLLPRPSLTAT